MNLVITETRNSFLPYQDFCLRNPGECDLSGPSVVELTPEQWDLMLAVNISVNRNVVFRLDKDQYHHEEFWAYPASGFGDCEDMALQKRAQLVRAGFPRGALRLAIGFHKERLSSHAVLTVETQQGTFVMDSETNRILLWYLTPYNFESRERIDGRWERFDQDTWEN